MEIDQWWPRLDALTQQWLIAHNGELVPADILSQITASGGVVSSEAWWVGESDPSGLSLSDRAVDWIEATANGESPTGEQPT
ncbi:MAG: hypothetical protein JWQ64_717 [Subtercola sp.]|nr:hypothetical protein [Subtercola sp.]